MTSPTYTHPQTNPPRPPEEYLPTMYDLPSEDPEEPGLDGFHSSQSTLLQETFTPPNYPTEQVFTALDLNLYYDVNHPLWYKKPDWFAVVGVPRLYRGEDIRMSYVLWQEGVSPFVAVELLSPGTEDEDLGTRSRKKGKPPTKWEVYEQILRIPYYVVFSRYTNELQVFHLVGGHYERVNLIDNRVAIPEIELSLGLWEGEYQGCHRLWLRWMRPDGELILTGTEEAQVQRQEAQIQRQEAQMQRQRADLAEEQVRLERERSQQLVERLRALGIDPDTL